MTKKEIIKKLKEKGLAFDEKQNKERLLSLLHLENKENNFDILLRANRIDLSVFPKYKMTIVSDEKKAKEKINQILNDYSHIGKNRLLFFFGIEEENFEEIDEINIDFEKFKIDVRNEIIKFAKILGIEKLKKILK